VRRLLALLAGAAGLAALVVVVIGAGGDAPVPTAPRVAAAGPEPQRARPASASTPRSAREPGHVRAEGPARGTLRIPAIGVAAPVIRLGLNPDGSLQVPAGAEETGYWSGGPLPGGRGAAVIAGHVDSRGGPAVFHRLGQLRPGDEISFAGRGAGAREARFVVRRVERHAKDDFPTDAVYEQTAEPTLRLITCAGRFDAGSGHYDDNLIVFAALVGA